MPARYQAVGIEKLVTLSHTVSWAGKSILSWTWSPCGSKVKRYLFAPACYQIWGQKARWPWSLGWLVQRTLTLFQGLETLLGSPMLSTGRKVYPNIRYFMIQLYCDLGVAHTWENMVRWQNIRSSDRIRICSRLCLFLESGIFYCWEPCHRTRACRKLIFLKKKTSPLGVRKPSDRIQSCSRLCFSLILEVQRW